MKTKTGAFSFLVYNYLFIQPLNKIHGLDQDNISYLYLCRVITFDGFLHDNFI